MILWALPEYCSIEMEEFIGKPSKIFLFLPENIRLYHLLECRRN